MSYSNVLTMKDAANAICKEINILKRKPRTPETISDIQDKEKRVREIRNAISVYKKAYGLQ